MNDAVAAVIAAAVSKMKDWPPASVAVAFNIENTRWHEPATAIYLDVFGFSPVVKIHSSALQPFPSIIVGAP